MAQIINLRQARKAKARADHGDKGAANRTLFGQSKADRAFTNATNQLSKTTLDGHRLHNDKSHEPDQEIP